MKRFSVAVIAALLFTSQQVEAAPKSIAASELTKVAPIAEHEGVAISNQGITIFSNVEKKVLVTSLDFLGAEKWTLAVEGATDQISRPSENIHHPLQPLAIVNNRTWLKSMQIEGLEVE